MYQDRTVARDVQTVKTIKTMQNTKMIIVELHKSGAVSGTVGHGALKWGLAMLSIMNASVELHLHQRYLLSP